MKTFVSLLLLFAVSPALAQNLSKDPTGDSARVGTDYVSIFAGGRYLKVVEIIADTAGSTQTLFIIAGSRADTTTQKAAKKVVTGKMGWLSSPTPLINKIVTDRDSVTVKVSSGTVIIRVNTYDAQRVKL